MRFTLESDDANGLTRLTAEPDEYDGWPPVAEVVFQIRLDAVDSDRLALACVLMFFPYLSGVLTLPDGCSPAMAAAIRELLRPRDIHISNVVQKPSKSQSGSSILLVDDESIASTFLQREAPPGWTVLTVPPTMSSGTHISLNHAQLEADAVRILLASATESEGQLALAGVGLLASSILMAGELVLPSLACDPLMRSRAEDASVRAALSRALLVTNLALSTPLGHLHLPELTRYCDSHPFERALHASHTEFSDVARVPQVRLFRLCKALRETADGVEDHSLKTAVTSFFGAQQTPQAADQYLALAQQLLACHTADGPSPEQAHQRPSISCGAPPIGPLSTIRVAEHLRDREWFDHDRQVGNLTS